MSGGTRAVLTDGHTGHVSRTPRYFFLFEGPPTGCGEINFSKLIILLLMLLYDRTNTSSACLVNLHTVVHGYCTGSVLLSLVLPGKYFLARGPVRLGVPRAPMQVKTALRMAPISMTSNDFK